MTTQPQQPAHRLSTPLCVAFIIIWNISWLLAICLSQQNIRPMGVMILFARLSVMSPEPKPMTGTEQATNKYFVMNEWVNMLSRELLNWPGGAIAKNEELWQPLDESKRGEWKVGLKLNIQKTKIMASGPITSRQIDGETVETVADSFGGAPKPLQMVTAAMILKAAYSLEGKLWPT